MTDQITGQSQKVGIDNPFRETGADHRPVAMSVQVTFSDEVHWTLCSCGAHVRVTSMYTARADFANHVDTELNAAHRDHLRYSRTYKR